MQLDATGVSRDPEVVANYLNDPLVNHGNMSARMVTVSQRGGSPRFEQFKGHRSG
jgi:alpha-beta hydrolase superfamily lysophospholipase